MNENVKKLFDMVGGLAPTFALPLAIGLAAPAWVLTALLTAQLLGTLRLLSRIGRLERTLLKTYDYLVSIGKIKEQ